MASQLTSAIFGGLEFTEAEAAFRPWWDTVEDNLVRGLLLMVGVAVTVPHLPGILPSSMGKTING